MIRWLKDKKHGFWIIRKHIMSVRRFKRDMKEYNLIQSARKKVLFQVDRDCLMPMLEDANKQAGNLDAHYFLQDITMAYEVNKCAPVIHYDIGSRVDGFISHLLSTDAVGKVVLVDVRPLSVMIDRLSFIQADAVKLANIEDNSIESLSSLHAIEHFGLGRYGDTIDPDGWEKALMAIQRKIKPGGRFYLSVPVGPKNKLVFNAHRIFAPSTIILTLKQMKLISFRCIHDMRVSSIDVKIDDIDNSVFEYDCGLFIFVKE